MSATDPAVTEPPAAPPRRRHVSRLPAEDRQQQNRDAIGYEVRKRLGPSGVGLFQTIAHLNVARMSAINGASLLDLGQHRGAKDSFGETFALMVEAREVLNRAINQFPKEYRINQAQHMALLQAQEAASRLDADDGEPGSKPGRAWAREAGPETWGPKAGDN